MKTNCAMKYYKSVLYILLIGPLITGVMNGKNSFLLKTNNAPLRIISMELASANVK